MVDYDSLISTDDRVMRLPHPIRCGVALPQKEFSWEQVFGKHTWAAMKQVFTQPGRLTPECLDILLTDPRNQVLAKFTNLAARAEGSTEMGSAFSTVVYLRHVLCPQPHFVVDDALVELLENTDISDDIPVDLLKLPYERCFVEFGRNRSVKERVPNVQSGLHVLEGAYVESGISSAHGQGLYVMFTGSPVGKENALDDATDSMFLPTANKEMLIRDALTWAHEKSKGLTAEYQLRQAPEEYAKYSFECLKLLVKVLLYLGLPQVRTSFHPEKTEMAKGIAAKKNPAKRAKAERQLRAVADYILVSAPPAKTEGLPEGSGGRGVKAHWRRGHYRLQAHGPQFSLRKLIFLQPVLVGVASGAEAPAANYVVR